MGRMLGEPIDFRPSERQSAPLLMNNNQSAGSLSTSHRLSQFLSCDNASSLEKWQQIAYSLLSLVLSRFLLFSESRVPPLSTLLSSWQVA
jgi:hypothetical protein